MELEQMKTLWAEMSTELEKQKKLTDALILRMTRSAYKNKLNKILVPEAIGSLIAFASVLYILLNFQKLNTWYLLTCGIVSVLILGILPLLSLRAICKIRSLHISENNYKQSLLEYSKGKIQFVFVQKLSFYLGAILMLVILPVMGELMDGMDFFKQTRLWMYYVIGFPFFHFFARWVFKHYIKSVADAENILKELE